MPKAHSSKPALRHLVNARVTTIISISLVLFLIGVTSMLVLFANELSVQVRENLAISIVMKENVNDVEIQKLQKMLDATPYVKSTEYIDKERAAKELSEELGEDPIAFLGYNPLLASLEVKLHSDYTHNDSIVNIETELKKYAEIKEVIYQKNLIQAINENVNRITFFLLGISALLLFISFALINNTVRLSIYAKRFLIHTMKLVGATGGFIRQPFILQGVFTGIVSAFIAMGLLSLLLFSVQSELGGIITLESLDFLLVSFLVMLLIGVVITFVSTYFAVNRYLRAKLNDMYFL
ncbi:MAG: ABC transporter permease [Paludibacteraceae bacterium]|nr:ABC transporter permease [Paludibacteraceae bacterium]MBP6284705.1 ABC transporter permease [Paludibacteraceae bacterium]